ncbi:MAG: hypothetical protein EPO63_08570 [Candidatus Nitrosotenuis sp.]|nr:MAG: hypothetical protein EPO63_08570 [Candidatus Nitrosotenuis sp.]
MNRLDALGFFAGTLTTIAFLPQVIRAWRTGKTDDLSMAMLVIFSIGVGVWLIYGLLLKSPPLIVANGITLFLVLIILGIKLRNLKRRP